MSSHIKSRKHPVAGSMRTQTSLATSAALAAGLALSLPAGAQTTPPATAASPTLPAVRVEGQAASEGYKVDQLSSPKFTQPLVDTTQTITVIPQEVIRQQQATTLTEAMRNVAGAGTFFAGENGNTSVGDAIFMRGINTSNSIYVDGIRDTATVYRDMFNIESVEVVKGPSGSDFGRSAPSGSINLATKKPHLENSFDATGSLGTDSYLRGTIDWNRQLGETSAMRLNVMGHKADVPGRDKVDNERWGVAPSLAFGLNTPTTVYLDYVHVKQNNTPDGGIATLGMGLQGKKIDQFPWLASAPKVDSSNFYGTASDHDDSTTDMLTARIEHKLSADTTIRNITRWAQTKQNYLLTAFMYSPEPGRNGSAPSLTYNPANPTDYSQWFMARSPLNFRDSDNQIITNQTNLTSKFATGSLKHTVSAGFELIREEQTLYNHTGSAPAVNVYNPNSNVFAVDNGSINSNKGKTDTIAAYAFDTVELTDRVQVNGGLRVDHYKTEYSGYSSATATAPVDLKTSDTLFTWKLGALYRLAPNGNVYANYAVSRQAPGGANFSLASSSGPEGAQSVAPGKAKTFELGTKWELFEKRLLTSAALFRTDIDNQVVALEDNTSYGQIGSQRIQGLELGAVGTITPRWSVMGGYTYQHATIEQGNSITSDGSDLLGYTPKHAVSLWSTYRLPSGVTLGGGARYVSKLTKGSDADNYVPFSTDGYVVFDAMASYQLNRNISLQLNIYNLFDKDYTASINKSGYRYMLGTPRTAILSANISF
ncbi:catecholate siderophore receptor Fiu [Pigmentiphaga soli]|uniref:Catecholate siderophore receptor Fiu n=1 Tax=Pigmentiphaga soli TaxID=1007095 RepID=A0ABP8GJ30_9BURK